MITPINTATNSNKRNNNLTFKAVTFVNIADKFKPIQKDLLKETDKFIKGEEDNVEKIGEGVFSKAFTFFKFDNIVIKASKIVDDFMQEMQALKNLPATLSHSQQFAARAYDDQTNKYYILSTKVEGDSPDPFMTPWNRRTLKNLFTGLFEMDKAGIYHGDLNNGNIKINESGDVNFIDFQWSTKLDENEFFENNNVQCMPDFIQLQNAQMLEMAEIPFYLSKMNNEDEAKEFMSEYLRGKSKYHGKRNDNLYNITRFWQHYSQVPTINKGLKYELAQEDVFRSPNKNIMKLETLKIQFLSAFREASKYLDPNTPVKNILAAPSSYLYALSCVKALKNEIQNQKIVSSINSKEADYLTGLNEFADYWHKNLKSWTVDAFYYPHRHTRNQLYKWEHVRHNFKDPRVNVEHFDNMTNITELVNKDFTPRFYKNFEFKDWYTKYYMDKINEDIKTQKDTNIIRAYEKLTDAYYGKNGDTGKGLDVINQSLLLTLRADQSKEDDLVLHASNLAELVFKNIFNDIENSTSIYNFAGYNDFNKFA